MKTIAIAEFEIIDHGIDHAQYFQGCGVSYTRFNHAVTGCGENAHDAFHDALEQLACSGEYDVATIADSDEAKEYDTDAAHNAGVTDYLSNRGEEAGEDCDLYYYVSIRIRNAQG